METQKIEEIRLAILNLYNKAILSLPLKDKVEFMNSIREGIHQTSPFNTEPVDFVKWVINDTVVANDYNPNKVAAPEMELLEISILNTESRQITT